MEVQFECNITNEEDSGKEKLFKIEKIEKDEK